MTTIYFVRHGSTENKGQIIYGRMPGFNLSDFGRKQAENAGKYFIDKDVKQIYTSPLERAFETADFISNQIPSSTITHSFELNEVESSSWQGLTPDELYKNNSYESFINNPNAEIGSENLNQLAARMKKFTESVIKKHKGGKVICVSHEFPILAIKLALEGKPLVSLKSYHLSTAAILEFQFDDDGKFIRVNSVTSA